MMSLLEDNDFMLVLTLIFIVSTFALVVFCSLPCTTKCFARVYNYFVKGRRVEDGSRWHSTRNETIGTPPTPVPSFSYAISPFTTATSSFTTTASIINLSSPTVSQANAIYAVNHQSLPIYSELDVAPPSYESLYPNPISNPASPVTYTNTDEWKSLFVDSCLQPAVHFPSKSNVHENFTSTKVRDV